MRVILTIITAVACLLLSLAVVLSAPVTDGLANAYVNTAGSNWSHDELVEVANAVRNFSLGNDAAALPQGADYRTAITPDAIQHLLDVRGVFVGILVAAAIAGLLFAAVIILTVRSRGAKALVWPLIIGGAIPLALAAILGIVVAIDFYSFFAWMHSIFFAAGSWTFPADSLLIRALPQPFWLGCVLVWIIALIVLCAASIGAGLVLRKKPVCDAAL